jgi:hypothetical protein
VRVHNLKHAFARRLRAARVAIETSTVLLGQMNNNIIALIGTGVGTAFL